LRCFLHTEGEESVAMMRTDKARGERSDRESDRLLWQRSRTTDAPEDETGRFLDLAAFADGLLDEEERDRVAALLTGDPNAAADVRAARGLEPAELTPAALERVIARACAIITDANPARGNVVALSPRQHRLRIVHEFAQWGSLAAALVLASWLGFAMGTNTSLALSAPGQPSEASFLPELFDPPTGLLRDLGEGLRT
jgi:anti-sigma factor RsiW